MLKIMFRDACCMEAVIMLPFGYNRRDLGFDEMFSATPCMDPHSIPGKRACLACMHKVDRLLTYPAEGYYERHHDLLESKYVFT